MHLVERGLEFVKEIDFGKVAPDDRAGVREILFDVLQFQNPMPDVSIDIYPVSGHYNVTIKGWNKEIDDEAWYAQFLGPDRNRKFDSIISTSTVPCVEGGLGPVKLIRIRKSSFNKEKRKK